MTITETARPQQGRIFLSLALDQPVSVVIILPALTSSFWSPEVVDRRQHRILTDPHPIWVAAVLQMVQASALSLDGLLAAVRCRRRVRLRISRRDAV
jgi:hypothetical protein